MVKITFFYSVGPAYFDVLCFGNVFSHSPSRGHWHGEVMIHAYEGIEDDQVQEFWEEIAKLSMIRHENIALFMGACIEPPHLAVITR
jgi:hypothetical protein